MTLKEIYRIVLDASHTNPLLFYTCLLIFLILIFILYKTFKRKKIIIEKDFVAMSDDLSRICVSGCDNFRAVWANGTWQIGYPEFNDLMDNFSEVKDLLEINKYSQEARTYLKSNSRKKVKSNN